MELFIRKITIQDLNEITEIFLRTYSKEPWNENWDQALAKARITDLIQNSVGINFCAINNDGNIVGNMFGRRNYWINSKEYFIDEFFIDYNHQNKGIGQYMINEASKILKNEGYRCVILNTEKNYPSEKFYKKNGFQQKTSNIFMYKDI